MESNDVSLGKFKQEEIEDTDVKALDAIYRLSLFNMISKIKEIKEDKIIFNPAGGFEFDPEFTREELNSIHPGLFQRLQKLSASIQSLGKQNRGCNWIILLKKLLTHADGCEKDELLTSKHLKVLKVREICMSIFSEISALTNDFNSHVITKESRIIKWGEIFEFKTDEKK